MLATAYLGRLGPTNRSSRSWHKKLLDAKAIDSKKKTAEGFFVLKEILEIPFNPKEA
jgi:hypothetical protein